MKNNPHVFKSIVYSLCFLVVNFLLPSCGASISTSKEEKSIENTRQLTHQHAIEHLLSKTYTADNGSIVEFYEQQEELRADVRVDESQKKPNYKNLPVFISSEVDIAQLLHAEKEVQKSLIHLNTPKDSQQGSISIFKNGLLGGMCYVYITLKNNSNKDVNFKIEQNQVLIIDTLQLKTSLVIMNIEKHGPWNEDAVLVSLVGLEATIKAHSQQILHVRCRCIHPGYDAPPSSRFDLAY